MAYFAQINSNDIVVQIIVIPDSEEGRGQQFINDYLHLPGEWIQCSYNGSIRRRYPGKGYIYNRIHDVFIEPRPAQSWSLDENFEWQPPVPQPDSDRSWYWDEGHLQWREHFISADKVTKVITLGDDSNDGD